MSISLDVVAQITRALAAKAGPDVTQITIASASADTHRVELLVTLARSPFEPRRVMLNLSRRDRVIFERQLWAQLQQVTYRSAAGEKRD